jgi:hypothetical protein
MGLLRSRGFPDHNEELSSGQSAVAWHPDAAHAHGDAPLSSPRIPIPKIILEGTHLTLKTDIAFALAEHPRLVGNRKHRWHIPLVSSEWETLSEKQPTKSDPGHSMIDFAPHEEAWAMEAYDIYMRLFELHKDYYWIVDRFHVSTRAHQFTTHGRDYDFGWLEERLARLNFHLVLCTREASSFPEARTTSLEYSENRDRYHDLDVFVREQELMRKLVASSRLPGMELDVTDNDVEAAANRVLDWVEGTGGYWRAD